MNKYFFVCLIHSKKNNSFYIGQCDDLDCRISKHNDGWSRYTSTKTPWQLKYFETFPTRQLALKREKELKAKKSRKYLQFLIDNKANYYCLSPERFPEKVCIRETGSFRKPSERIPPSPHEQMLFCISYSEQKR